MQYNLEEIEMHFIKWSRLELQLKIEGVPSRLDRIKQQREIEIDILNFI